MKDILNDKNYLLLQLYARAKATEYYPKYINDTYSQDVIIKFDYDFTYIQQKVNAFKSLAISSRHIAIFEIVKNYIKENKKACVVNLGCGLDTMSTYFNNEEIKFYNVDEENIIKIRENYIKENKNTVNISSKVFDTDNWFNKIDYNEKDGLIIVSCGLFYFIDKEPANELIHKIAKRFTNSKIAFDCNKIPIYKKRLKSNLEKLGLSSDLGTYTLLDYTFIYRLSENIKRVSSNTKIITGYRKLPENISNKDFIKLKFLESLRANQIIEIEIAKKIEKEEDKW